jgi:hypothetical protein
MSNIGKRMNTVTANDAKDDFGRRIDPAREPRAVAKRGRSVIFVTAMEERVKKARE